MAKRVIMNVRNSHGNLVKLQKGESKRTDGMLVYRYIDADGKRKTLSSTTIEGLREKEEALNIDKVKGIKTDKSIRSVDTVANEWFELKRGLREHTMQNYTWLYTQYVKESPLGKKKIKNVTYGDIKKFYNTLHDVHGLAIATIDGLQTVLRQIFDYAVKQRYIDLNPTVDALKELKKAHNTGGQKHKALTLAEHKRFLDFMANSETYKHWYNLFAIMVGTGMRVGELTGLRWCDVDIVNGNVEVSHTLVYYKSNEGMTWQINEPKTRAGKRNITMLNNVKQAFKDEKLRQDKENIKSNAIIDGYSDFVFFNRFGNVQHQGTLNKALRRIIRDANYDALEKNDGTVLLPKFSCHNLRTTFCTRLAENGVSLKVAMSLMGHDDSRTTMEVYTSVCKDWEKRELESVNEALKALCI